MLQTKYMILIWVIVLILFTFFCVYRLSGMTPRPTQFNVQNNEQLPINKFANIDDIKPQPTSDNIMTYIENIQKADSLKNTPECNTIYDDNIAIRSLGYNNCESANADYFASNLDINNKYGYPKSLSELCPVTTKSEAYMNCMRNLLNKFNQNANILDKINTDMTSILNKRLNNRSDVLNNIEIATDILDYEASILFSDVANLNLSLNLTGTCCYNTASPILARVVTTDPILNQFLTQVKVYNSVIDYFDRPFGRSWRCDRAKWRQATVKTFVGAPGGDWFHVEIALDKALYAQAVSLAFTAVYDISTNPV